MCFLINGTTTKTNMPNQSCQTTVSTGLSCPRGGALRPCALGWKGLGADGRFLPISGIVTQRFSEPQSDSTNATPPFLLWAARVLSSPRNWSLMALRAPVSWPTAPSLQLPTDPTHPQAHLQRRTEGDTRHGLGTDGHVPRIHNGAGLHIEAFDQHRVLPLVTVLPGKATDPE